MFLTSRVEDCCVLDLPNLKMERGNVTSINNGLDVPFDVKRVYFLFDVPHQSVRGGHAHRELYQLIVAMGGAFSIDLFDGQSHKHVRLDRPDQGLLVVPGIWRELHQFSACSTCFVLASEEYDESDYIRTRVEFADQKPTKP